jgi:hypothetical protein
MARTDISGTKHNKKNNMKENRKRCVYSQKCVRLKEVLTSEKKSKNLKNMQVENKNKNKK